MSQSTHLTLPIDADVQGVGLTPGSVYDCRRALRVEVVALRQAVECTGLDTACFYTHTYTHTAQAGRYQKFSLPREHRQHDTNTDTG